MRWWAFGNNKTHANTQILFKTLLIANLNTHVYKITVENEKKIMNNHKFKSNLTVLGPFNRRIAFECSCV